MTQSPKIPAGCILHVSASPRGSNSHSKRAGQEFIEQLKSRAEFCTIYRGLSNDPPPLTTRIFADALAGEAWDDNSRQDDATGASKTAISQLKRSSALLIDTPMYNFAVPAVLKAWIDLVVRRGVTFETSSSGKTGLLKDRPAYLIVSSGGPLTPGPGVQQDYLTPYLRYVLTTIGIHTLSVLHLESMSRGIDAKGASEISAEQWISKAVADFRI